MHLSSPTPAVDVLRAGATTVVIVTGEVDLDSVSRLRAAVNDLVVDGHVHLVLDLTAVTFMDSAGLGALIGVHRKCRGLGGRMVLVVTPAGPVAQVLAITGLSRVLTCHPTRESALEGVA